MTFGLVVELEEDEAVVVAPKHFFDWLIEVCRLESEEWPEGSEEREGWLQSADFMEEQIQDDYNN